MVSEIWTHSVELRFVIPQQFGRTSKLRNRPFVHHQYFIKVNLYFMSRMISREVKREDGKGAYDGMYTMSNSQNRRIREFLSDRFGDCLISLISIHSPKPASGQVRTQSIRLV